MYFLPLILCGFQNRSSVAKPSAPNITQIFCQSSCYRINLCFYRTSHDITLIKKKEQYGHRWVLSFVDTAGCCISATPSDRQWRLMWSPEETSLGTSGYFMKWRDHDLWEKGHSCWLYHKQQLRLISHHAQAPLPGRRWSEEMRVTGQVSVLSYSSEALLL